MADVQPLVELALSPISKPAHQFVLCAESTCDREATMDATFRLGGHYNIPLCGIHVETLQLAIAVLVNKANDV